MKDWTREEKYRPLDDPAELLPLYSKALSSPWRQQYHIGPLCGLLNDPNGFSFFRHEWHLFYQWCPWGAVHGLKHWYHVSSKDLVHWQNLGLAIAPGEGCDNKGVFSGTALPREDRLLLYYAGNHRTEDWQRVPYTCFAEMDAAGRIEKAPAPLFLPQKGYTEHQRDPKIIEKDGRFYIILGAQNQDLLGRLLVYRSEFPDRGWELAGELAVPGYENFGNMWECPSLERLGGKDLLIFCPQHLKLPGRGETPNHNVCLIGTMDWKTLTFLPEGPYRLIDDGFDCYAAQCAAEGISEPETLTLIAWMGLPDAEYPSDEEEWSGCLSLPRRLTIREGRLIQAPPKELEALRGPQLSLEGTAMPQRLPNTCEIELEASGPLSLSLLAKPDGSGGISVSYDPSAQTLTLDRSGMTNRFNISWGEARSVFLQNGLASLRVFLDASSLEIFANDGEAVLTTRTFPKEDEHYLVLRAGFGARVWPVSKCVDDRFIV